ncbi:hypothetical protein [Escherichia coli]|uniref:hypothetical protein n=1 Tax=Escherichia coli TaxID=562 RepID=UPI0028797DA7|nr:hypothetical protein [Escherichia coli]MDS1617161.1 hypothetical protein [Escherichia coli]
MINPPVTTITLNLPTSFTGRVLVSLEKGHVVSWFCLEKDSFVATTALFAEGCIRAGIKPEQLTGK